MDDKKTRTWFSNRQFVAAIRAALDEAGRPDIAVSRQWIDEDTPGYRFLMNVPVGAALTVPLKAMTSFFEARSDDDLQWNAREFAKALINLNLAGKMLEKYARDVCTAASAAIAAARADGLDLLLEDVGFKPTYAYHLTGASWKDAAYHVLAAVTVRHTSFYLRPDRSEIWVEEPADIADELAGILVEQRERQDRLAELDALDADLVVDQITLDLLAAHGLDADETLSAVWKKQCVNLKVDHLGRETSLSLITSDGKVTASLTLQDAFWNGEHLWFTGDERMKDHKHLIGKSVGDLVQHPVFASRPIVDVVHRHADHVVFDLSEKVLFDADTGRFRPLPAAANDRAGGTGAEAVGPSYATAS